MYRAISAVVRSHYHVAVMISASIVVRNSSRSCQASRRIGPPASREAGCRIGNASGGSDIPWMTAGCQRPRSLASGVSVASRARVGRVPISTRCRGRLNATSLCRNGRQAASSIGLWLAVAGWPPRDQRRDQHLRARHSDAGQHAVEQRARRAGESDSGAILVGVRNLADEQQHAAGIAFCEQGVARGIAQRATGEPLHRGPQGCDAAGRRSLLFRLPGAAATQDRRCGRRGRRKRPRRWLDRAGGRAGRALVRLPCREPVMRLLVERLVGAPLDQ